MAIEENKQLVTGFWQAISESRMDAARAMLHDDLTWWITGNTALSGKYDKAGFIELISGAVEATESGIQVTPVMLTAEDNRVAMEAVSDGTLKNGKKYENKYHFLHFIRDGRIIGVHEYMDTEHVTAVFGG